MLHTFYFLVTSHPIIRVPTLVAGFFLALMLALAACGGGDAPDPVEPTEAPMPTSTAPASSASATPASQPASTRTPGSTASTPAPASTSAPRSTESAASTGAATSAPTSVAPTSAPAEPTAVPAMILPPGLLTARPCEEVFREMLANYNGVERFDVALVTALSDQFVELRPDCLAQGWDPQFSDEPVVCEDWTHLPGAIHDGRAQSQKVAPTQWIVDTARVTGAGDVTVIRINVHLDRVPLSSDIPKSMNYSGGDLVGGCWAYKGSIYPDGHSSGRWYRSFFKYRLQGRSIIRGRVSPQTGVVGVTSPTSQPGCDARLQDLLSAELDAGAVPDAVSMAGLIAKVRSEAGGACAAVRGESMLWQPLPLNGSSLACPVGSEPGLQPDGSFVLNWGDRHYDLYGHSACWRRSPEGDWGAYLVSEDGPARPEAPVVEAQAPPDPDREVLMALYRAWGGNRWHSSFTEHWATDAPLERWKGVHVRDGRVVGLDLTGAGVRGEIPVEIVGLASLEFLNLGGNALTGEIPPELVLISGLTGLALNDNGLTGEIPVELGNLSNLRNLNLGNNMLTGRVPPGLGNLAALEYLDLRGNDLTGCVPAGLQEQLEWLVTELDYCEN